MASEAVKLEREKRKTAREAKLWEVLANPNVIRILSLATLLYGARTVRDWADTPEHPNIPMRDVSIAVASIGAPLIAASAGITDKYALAAIAGFSGLAVGEGRGGLISFTGGGGTVDLSGLEKVWELGTGIRL
jgi:hypothetical protein